MKTLFIALMISGSVFAQGQDKGNGGDIIVCKNISGGQDEVRVLDSYLMTEVFKSFTFSNQGQNSDARLSLILNKLNNKEYQFLYVDLKRFSDNFFKRGNFNPKLGAWLPSKVQEIWDENLRIHLPTNCFVKQVVIRVEDKMKKYYYDAEIVDYLTTTNDITWLIIHEWLRDYEEDADVIRIINGYLHSDKFLTDSPKVVSQMFSSMGFYRTSVILKISDYDFASRKFEWTDRNAQSVLKEARGKDLGFFKKRSLIKQLRFLLVAYEPGWIYDALQGEDVQVQLENLYNEIHEAIQELQK